MQKLQAFQAAIYNNIPLVENMQLQLQTISSHRITATAPIAPNINDKSTVFGGSSAALMTICGWSLIKYQLESYQLANDVVIHQSKLRWNQAQTDDLIITATTESDINWTDLITTLKNKNRSTKIKVNCEVLNQANQVCSQMQGSYVILKDPNIIS